MNILNLIDSLARFADILPQIVRPVSQEDARWKPPSGAWSILEIVCHLADEEELDFRQRVALTLADPDTSWPPIDPEGWAVTRHYNDRQLAEEAARFVQLRNDSVGWLRALEDPDWSRAHQHPKAGPLRAGDIFAAWVAHDLLHLRQLSKRLYQMVERDAEPYSVFYAGEWGP